ncbi:hypothetical protein SUSAZ_10025 [Sulfolobus acidocaldarius SUSAZ]|nr:hypothetical protein SUSAZ_10025 [Sulfolobus acidocaldarius SUSAZ]
MLVLGGAGTTLGAVIGTLVYTTLCHLVDIYKQQLGSILNFDPVWLQYILFGLLLTVLLVLRPEGIYPEKNRSLLKPKELSKADKKEETTSSSNSGSS